ncbi:MAG: 2-(3-amino-3-carboxypropyl)histidine synthase subunit 1/2 [Nitrososphaera sp.]|uniref:2-(3-amino-3-carboxypropyl)histidine synthase subunit 1/2 n=1 Tax=Nitrososphaera sp. TaxID=1971748 RepID=UPI001851A52C|nr:2-(3-amino-3-carboxypropyl)histidine synthase subunit 1/2 [Nitrososphaera sp.]NWG38268.1 diphthamide synthesis protein [Nitrososphaera sp.]
MIRIDERRIFEVIEERKPHSVALNGAEALIPKLQDAADHISERFGIEAYVIGDTCWGSCDLNTHAADMLGADILFSVGHTVAMETFGDKVVMINAYDDVSFDKVAYKFAEDMKGKFSAISLLTDSQHLEQVEGAKRIFEDMGYRVIIGKGKGQLKDAQVFGCEFYPAWNVQKQVDAYVFLGQSQFHAASVAMSTEKPTFMLDPYFEEYTQVNEFAQGLQKRAILAIYKAADANTIGLVIGLKEGQFAHVRALELKKEFERLGKKVQLIALTEITDDRMQIFKNIDAFVQVACPRIATDNHFSKPMLSVPQALALIKLLKKEPVEDFLRMQHWL